MNSSGVLQQRICSYSEAVKSLKDESNLPHRPLLDLVARISTRAERPLVNLVKFATILPCNHDGADEADVMRARLPLRRVLTGLVSASQTATRAGLGALLHNLLPGHSNRMVDISSEVALPIAALVHAAPLGIPEMASRELLLAKLEVFDRLVTGAGLERFHEADTVAGRYIDLSGPAVDRIAEIFREAETAPDFRQDHPWRVYNMWTLGLFPLVTLLCDAVLCLARRPELQEPLRLDTGSRKAFLDECLRLYPGIPTLWRSGAASPDAGGRPVCQRIEVKAAMRDPGRYDRPEDFVPGRSVPPGLAFGVGAVACLGKNLTYRIAEDFLKYLLDTFEVGPVMQPVEQFSFDMLSFYRYCPVSLTPR
ncbi:MAG: hypothetical protein EP335_05670 [Alphaproteobacteria bacterium]|nr:MAG: hypothetical protein EP335_05670 [Alphaproteobacteria bacterium]